MNSKVSSILKYLFLLCLTAGLLWYAVSNIEVEPGQSKGQFILNAWNKAEKKFLIFSGLIALFSHFLRSERWKILLKPLGYEISSVNSFLSVMVGYFINLAIPRGGEVSRCYNLYRLEKVPVNVSLGSVIGERVVDLIFLVLFICGAFLIEFENLFKFFNQLSYDSNSGEKTSFVIIWYALGVVALGLILVYVFVKLKRRLTLKIVVKVRQTLVGFKEGAMAVFKLKRKLTFMAYTVLIWSCYYMMTYFIMLAFKETAAVGFAGALTIFTIGGIAMAVPLPGGMGSYHLLIPLGLQLLYGLEKGLSISYTFILHGWQTIVILTFGAIAMILSQIISDKKNAND